MSSENQKSSRKNILLERFRENGCKLDGMTESELLYLVLYAVTGREGRSEELLPHIERAFGSVDKLMMTSPSVLYRTGLFSVREICRLRVLFSVMTRSEILKLGRSISADDDGKIRRYLKLFYMGSSEEIVYIIPVMKNKLGAVQRLASGGEKQVGADPEILLALLNDLPGCKEFIMAHNHPNEPSTPSNMDIRTTERIFGAAYMKGYTLKEHYVVGTDGVSTVPFSRNLMKYFFKT